MGANDSGGSRTSLWRSLLPLAILGVSIYGGTELRARWRQTSEEGSSELPPTDGVVVQAMNVSEGRAHRLFGEHCAKCHGEAGHGDGEGLRPLSVRPRDFRSDHWKQSKTAESIQRVIREGITGTPMPAFKKTLSDADVTALASLVLDLAILEKESRQPDPDTAIIQAGFTPVIPGKIPPISLVKPDGAETLLIDVVQGPAIIHFWGVTCLHCIGDFPRLKTVAQEFREVGVPLVSICGDEADHLAIERFAKEFPEFDFYVDPSGLAMNRFSTSLLPTLFLVDANGWVIGVSNTPLERDQIQRVRAAVSNGASSP